MGVGGKTRTTVLLQLTTYFNHVGNHVPLLSCEFNPFYFIISYFYLFFNFQIISFIVTLLLSMVLIFVIFSQFVLYLI